jgi:hypothetical protein
LKLNTKILFFFHFKSESELSDTPCKPVFVQSLLDITINEGEKLKLHAAINANPEPEVKNKIFYLFFFKSNFSFKDYLVSK